MWHRLARRRGGASHPSQDLSIVSQLSRPAPALSSLPTQFHTFFCPCQHLAKPKLIGVQFIKMTATFIHNDLQSCWGDAMIRILYLNSSCLPWSPAVSEPVCPQSLFFITRCHQICSPIKIFTLITISYQGMLVPAQHWSRLPSVFHIIKLN